MNKKTASKYIILIVGIAIVSSLLFLFDNTIPHAQLESIVLQSSEPMVVAMREETLEDLFWMFVPSEMSINNNDEDHPETTMLSLVGIKYLDGSNDTGQAKLIGVFYPGKAPEKLPSPVFVKTDGVNSLQSIGERILADTKAPDWVVISELKADWTSWHLTLSINDGNAVIVQKPIITNSPPDFLLMRLKSTVNAVIVKNLDTSSFRLPIGMGRDVQLKANGIFTAETAIVRMYPQTIGVATELGKTPTFDDAPNGSTVAINVPYGFLNRIFASDLNGSIPVTSPNNGQTVSMSDFNIRSEDVGSAVFLTAKVDGTPGNSIFRYGGKWKGADLRLDRFTVVQADCGNLILLDCAAEKAKHNVLAGVVNNTRRNKLLRKQDVQKFTVHLSSNFSTNILSENTKISASSDGIKSYLKLWLAMN